ncbi:hypothetical protein Glove_29g170 [Diversispora epigaea]|uniref:Uncharacterized protein n=1 Tax=Diversispora epigaea TaxID=1348612 RepID=A0A397JJW8_9GLOM|nr:hypothetical protein Glove_29g169 [Diversispora epigaea]RHZ87907.1 hypothetical protein Glove_29g170 [Diversispora epigaea]
MLFLISILLLIGITTVAIGAPVAETIESIKAIEIPQMGSSNLTLNRRFINGVPGLPQCIDANFPDLVTSSCIDEYSIRAYCAPATNSSNQKESDTACPSNTICMDFRTENTENPYTQFAICTADQLIKDFGSDSKDGEVCKSFEINIKSDKGTLSINVYDATARPVQVSSISISTKNQVFTISNTSTYSIIIDMGKTVAKKARVCLKFVVGVIAVHAWVAVIDEVFAIVDPPRQGK